MKIVITQLQYTVLIKGIKVRIEKKTSCQTQFRELKDGDLFTYASEMYDKNEIFLKIDKGAYETYRINAVNLNCNIPECFGMETVVTKINGTLFVD